MSPCPSRTRAVAIARIIDRAAHRQLPDEGHDTTMSSEPPDLGELGQLPDLGDLEI